MKRVWIIGGASAFALLIAVFSFLVYVLLASGNPTYWQEEIAAFERGDISNPPQPGRVLFVGGTDVRQWENLLLDMDPIPVIARGFGGAQIAHVTYYIPRIVAPYQPSAIVLMAGEADLADVRGRRPEDVRDDVRKFLATLRTDGVNAPVYFVSIRPSPLRTSRWFGAERANALVKEEQKTVAGLHYIDVSSAMFDKGGKIRDDLFRWDGLTLNETGFAVMGERIKAALLADGYGAVR